MEIMSARINALTVVLEKDLHEDAAKELIAAISCVRGVQSVGVNVADIDSHIAQEHAKIEKRDCKGSRGHDTQVDAPRHVRDVE